VSPAAARVQARIASGFAWLALAACSGGERPRSILIVTLDTTRADRLGCYGRNGAETPVLDGLAARGARFERAYTTAPITLPAHASLLTGATPPHHGLRDNGIRALDPGVVTLAEVARAAGLRTGAFVSGFPLDSLFGLEQGFETYSDDFGAAPDGGTRMQERRGGETVAAARAWLATLAADESFFLWVHLFDAHEPYQAPSEFAQRFPSDPYQAEIAYQDSVLGELLGALEAGGRSADTLVVVTADHGEGLGEHGEETHALLLYDTTMRVPLVLAGPGVQARVCAEPVSLIDVAPTLVELARLPGGEEFARHGGTSLAPLLRGETLPPRELYLETLFPRLHFGWSELVGLVQGEWKFVAAPGQARAELFRPAQDPREADEVLAQETLLGTELANSLDGLRRRLEANAFRGASHAPSASELETLAALGYGGVDAEAEVPRADAAPEPGRDPRQTIAAVGLLNRVRGLAAYGRFEEAARALDELAALDPGAIVLSEARGDFHLARGRAGARADLEQAHVAFRQATELKPGRRGLWLRRSEVCERLGLLREALECVDQALSLAPPSPEFAAAREDLRRRAEAEAR
jgi:arylsulfatase A-like enzyme